MTPAATVHWRGSGCECHTGVVTDLSTSLTTSERARVHATAWTILGDTHAAEDVAQELAMRLQEDPAAEDPHLRGSWIARQALGLSLNRRRARVRRSWHEEVAGGFRAEGWVESPEWLVERAEEADQVREALASLDEVHRSPLILRYFHGRRLNEIATILGVPLSTAHERIQRGLHFLRGRLRRTEVAPALIGLALPRATVLVAPVVVATRASIAVGTVYGLARAAVLAGLLGLAPQADPEQATASADLDLARIELPTTPPHFVRAPGTPQFLIDPVLPDEPPVRPPGPRSGEVPEGPLGEDSDGTDEVVFDSSQGRSVAAGGSKSEPGSEGGQALGWVAPVGDGRQAVGQGPATRPYVAPESMHSQRPEDDDDEDGPDTDNADMGSGAGGGDDSGGDGPGIFLGASYGGASLEGNLHGWDSAAGFTRPLANVVVQLLAAQAGAEVATPVAATALSDEHGAFSLELPGVPGHYQVRVGVVSGDEFLSLGPGLWSLDASGAWTVEFESLEPVGGTGF